MNEREREVFTNCPAGASDEVLAAYLERACGDDSELRVRVEGLVAADRAAGGEFMSTRKDVGRVAFTAPGGQPDQGMGADVIGGYKLLQEIGQGGFGVVYMAEQLRPVKRRVAFKVIKLGMDTKQVVARFEAERQALAMMDHPNIAKVYDAGSTEAGRPFFVMELVRGVPITEFCDSRNLETRERLGLFSDVCRAVQHAHQKGVIHRDLKPSNVMVTMHDDRPVVKVIDFGVAKATQQELTDRTLFTRFEQFIGTPAYMSPEQAQMSGLDIDTRSDIYSLGVLLYELLTGRTPFDSKELAKAGYEEIRRVIREEEPPKPSTRLSTLGDAELTDLAKHRGSEPSKLRTLLRGDLDWIVMKALEKDRTRRYETANALAMDVGRHLADEPVVARPPSAVYRMQKAWRRNRLAATAGAAVVLALVFAAVASTWSFLREREARREVAFVSSQNVEQSKLAAEGARMLAQQEKANALDLRRRLARQYLRQGQQQASDGHIDFGMHLLSRALAECPDATSALRDDIGANLGYWGARSIHLVQLFDHEREQARGNLAIAGQPLALGFSPDGKLLVTGGVHDHAAKIWSVETGDRIGKTMGHESDLTFAFFVPDGSRIVTTTTAGVVRLWTAMGEPVGDPLIENAILGNFDDESGRLAACDPQGRLTVWSTGSGQVCGRAVSPRPDVRGVELRSGGDRLLVIVGDGSLYDIPVGGDGQIRKVLQDRTAEVWEFSDDASRLLTAEGYGETRLWSTETGDVLATLSDPKVVRYLVFSPDGSKVAVGSNHEIRLYSARDGAPLAAPLTHRSGITEVLFSPDGNTLLTVDLGFSLRRWSCATGLPLGSPVTRSGRVGSATFSADGTQFALSSYGRAEVWAIGAGRKPAEQLEMDGLVWTARFGPRGDEVIAGSSVGRLQVWDRGSRKARSFEAGFGYIWTAEPSPNGEWLAVSFSVGEKSDQGAVLRPLGGGPGTKLEHGGPARTVAFDRSSRLVATGGWNRKAAVWTVPSGDLVCEFGHPEIVEDLVFLPGSEILVTACGDHRVRFWPIGGEEETGPAVVHRDAVLALELSPDGSVLATGSRDRTARLWSVETRSPMGPPLVHDGWVEDVAFSADGRVLLTGSNTGAAQLWSVASGEKLGPAFHHKSAVLSVALDPQGEYVLTSGALGARLWEFPDVRTAWDGDAKAWVESRTGYRMDTDGILTQLTTAEWREAREAAARE